MFALGRDSASITRFCFLLRAECATHRQRDAFHNQKVLNERRCEKLRELSTPVILDQARGVSSSAREGSCVRAHAPPCLGWVVPGARIYIQVAVISGVRRRAGGQANEGWEVDSFKNESWNEGWNEGWPRGAGFLKDSLRIP